MIYLSILKPSYRINLKNKMVADFRNVPKRELNHYYNPNHYRTSTIMGRVISFEEHCKLALKNKTETGLFPPEVLIINMVENEGRPYPLGWGAKYSDFWWFECGIVDLSFYIKRLEKKGYLELRDGRYHATQIGKNEIKQNEAIIWAYNACYRNNGLKLRGNLHKTTSIGGIWNIKEINKYHNG